VSLDSYIAYPTILSAVLNQYASFTNAYSLNAETTLNGNLTGTNLFAFSGTVSTTSGKTITITDAYCGYFNANIYSGSTITTLSFLNVHGYFSGGTIGTLYGLRVRDDFTFNGVAVTDLILINAGRPNPAHTGTISGTIYGLRVPDLSSWSNNYAIYTAGGNHYLGGYLDINSDLMRIRNSKTISSSSDSGNPGELCWDSTYLYLCVDTDTWKRIELSSW